MTKDNAHKFYDEIAPHFIEYADGNMEAEMLDNLWNFLCVCDDNFIESFTYTFDNSVTKEYGTPIYANPQIWLQHKKRKGVKIEIGCGGYTIYEYDRGLYQSFPCHINSPNTGQALKMLECFKLLDSSTCR